jgi:hypothetical protein
VVAELDQVRLEGEPHNPSGFAIAACLVNTLDEFAERQLSFSAMSFHDQKYRL